MIGAYFPYDIPRQCQIDTLRAVEKHWDDYSVFVIRAPTGSGKAGIGVTIQSWQLDKGKGCCYLVPNNVLRDQCLREFDWLRTIKAQEEYWSNRFEMTEKAYRKKIDPYGRGSDTDYQRDYRIVKNNKAAVVANYYTYIAHKLQREILIVDEAHQLLKTLQDMNAKRIWKHLHGYPPQMRTLADILDWIESKPQVTGLLAKLRNEIKRLNPATVIETHREFYRGAEMDCLKLIPIIVSGCKPIYWPKSVKKIILMSATIGEAELKAMGLDKRRILYIDVDSPIPQEKRRVIYRPVTNMSFSNQGFALPTIAQEIQVIAAEHQEKGFIHATYDVADKLRKYLTDSRFMFHTRENKKEVYKKFYNESADSGKILVGSGMYEGIDLKFDVANWQVILKVPYPSLMNAAMRYLSKNNPELYQWLTTKDILQASGRICRDPKDIGITYLLDTKFADWYSGIKFKLPKWFKVEGL